MGATREHRMATATTQLASLLVSRGLVSDTQLDKARALQQESGCTLEDAVIRLGDASAKEIAHLRAEIYSVPFIDLADVYIPPAVVELVPESVARECIVMPLAVAP